MSIARPSLQNLEVYSKTPPLPPETDLQSALAENARLRQLIVRLSDIILRQVVADFNATQPTS